jgi:Asp-tRNA(Asn)/Glu-tRNA(Gln) amidotransferase B subunit
MAGFDKDKIIQDFGITPEEFEKVASLLRGEEEVNGDEVFTLIITLNKGKMIDVYVDTELNKADLEDISQLLSHISNGNITTTIVKAFVAYAKDNPKKALMCKKLIQKWQEKEQSPYVPAFQPIES